MNADSHLNAVSSKREQDPPKIWVVESGSFWTKWLQAVLGSMNQVTSMPSQLLSKELQQSATSVRLAKTFIAVEYSRDVLKDFLSLFDKMPAKLENLDWLLLNAPKNVRIQSLMREFGFSIFLDELKSVNEFKKQLEFLYPSSGDATSKRTFEDEMFRRIPLERINSNPN